MVPSSVTGSSLGSCPRWTSDSLLKLSYLDCIVLGTMCYLAGKLSLVYFFLPLPYCDSLGKVKKSTGNCTFPELNQAYLRSFKNREFIPHVIHVRPRRSLNGEELGLITNPPEDSGSKDQETRGCSMTMI